MRVLLIEDDRGLGDAVCKALRDAGITVDWAGDGEAGRDAAMSVAYDAVILDLGLPDGCGLALLKGLRAAGNAVKVLIASGRATVADRIAGLNAGGDDYLVKPFDVDELIARLHALVRRHAGAASSVTTVGTLSFDPVDRRVTQAGRERTLTAKEFALLEALLRKPGAVVSRRRLEESIYGWGEEVASNAVEVHLHNLRRKLGVALIRNVRGAGYRVVV